MKIMALPIFEKFPPIEHISGKRDWLSDPNQSFKKAQPIELHKSNPGSLRHSGPLHCAPPLGTIHFAVFVNVFPCILFCTGLHCIHGSIISISQACMWNWREEIKALDV